jgi:hypothetical protein
MKATAPWIVAILLLALSPLEVFGRITNRQPASGGSGAVAKPGHQFAGQPPRPNASPAPGGPAAAQTPAQRPAVQRPAQTSGPAPAVQRRPNAGPAPGGAAARPTPGPASGGPAARPNTSPAPGGATARPNARPAPGGAAARPNTSPAPRVAKRRPFSAPRSCPQHCHRFSVRQPARWNAPATGPSRVLRHFRTSARNPGLSSVPASGRPLSREM